MTDLNDCHFTGRLGADPELRRTQDGRPIASFNLAVSNSWRDKNTGERKEKTTWVPVVIFNEGLCKITESYLRKGSFIRVRGAFSVRKWQDKDGNDRYSTEVVLQGFNCDLQILDRKHSSDEPARQEAQSQSFGGGDFDNEIPF